MFKKIFSKIGQTIKTRKLKKLGLTEEKQNIIAQLILSRAKTEINCRKIEKNEKIPRSFITKQTKKAINIINNSATKYLISKSAMTQICKAMKINENYDLLRALTHGNKEELSKLVENPEKVYSNYLRVKKAILNNIKETIEEMPTEEAPQLSGKPVYSNKSKFK